MRPLTLSVAATGAATVTALVPSSAASLVADPAGLLGWWDATGTAAATMTIVQLLAVAAFGYVAVVALLVALADALRLRGLRRAVLRVATPQLRRALAAGAVAAAVALPAPLAASTDTTPFAVTDVGPAVELADTTSFVVADLGPSPAAEVAEVAEATDHLVSTAAVRDSFRPPTPSPTVADAWLVESGDHLWSIAETTLFDATGVEPSDADVTRYWGALIDANTNVVVDADLIFPGQVLTLPPVPTAGS